MSPKPSKKQCISIVKKMSREDLESLVMCELEADNFDLENAILLHFNPGRNKEDWVALINKFLDDRRNKSTGTFKDAPGFIFDIYELIMLGKDSIDIKANQRAFDIGCAIVEAIAPVVYEAIEGNGFLNEIVGVAFLNLIGVAGDADTQKDTLLQVRTWARSQIHSKWVDANFEWENKLFEIDLISTRNEAERKDFLEYCEPFCSPGDKDFSGRALAENLSSFICTFLAQTRAIEELKSFIALHLHLDSVRSLEIEIAISTKDLDKAERLTREGLAHSLSQSDPRIYNQYIEQLVTILDARGKHNEALEILIKETIGSGSMDWYAKIVARLPKPSARNAVVDRIIVDIGNMDKGFAAEICKAEQRWEQLLKIANDAHSIMVTHYKTLGEHFPDQIAAWLKSEIRSRLQASAARGTYRWAASRIAELGQLAGAEEARLITEEMIAEYPTRIAMADELRNPPVKKKK